MRLRVGSEKWKKMFIVDLKNNLVYTVSNDVSKTLIYFAF